MLAANLLAKLNDDPKFAGLLARLQRSHKRLDRMLKASLDKIALDSGKEMAANKSLVDLHSVIDEVVSENLAVLEERVTVEGHGTGHWDADAIFRVVENLLLNALKYGNPGTVIECSIQSSATHVQLLVHNSGPPHSGKRLEQDLRALHAGAESPGQNGLGRGPRFLPGWWQRSTTVH